MTVGIHVRLTHFVTKPPQVGPYLRLCLGLTGEVVEVTQQGGRTKLAVAFWRPGAGREVWRVWPEEVEVVPASEATQEAILEGGRLETQRITTWTRKRLGRPKGSRSTTRGACSVDAEVSA